MLSMHLGQEDVGAEPTDTTARLRPDRQGLRGGTNGPFLISTQLSKPAKPNQKNLNTISQNEKQLQQQQQQIEQQAELEGATQQQVQQEAKQQTQKQVQRARQQEEEGRAAGNRPAPADPAQGPPEDQGRRFRDAAAGQQAGSAAVYTLIATTSPSDIATEDLVSRLRDRPSRKRPRARA